jgi:hypothetical protein
MDLSRVRRSFRPAASLTALTFRLVTCSTRGHLRRPPPRVVISPRVLSAAHPGYVATDRMERSALIVGHQDWS